jgi:SAM-dependent methyltransferase
MKLNLRHSLLRLPMLYIALQRLLGADRVRRICLDQFMKLREGERVLDIGCGPGYILDYMPRVDYVGFDTEPRYIEYANRHYRDRGRFYCEHFVREHVTTFASFDAIMLFGIIHHLDDVAAEELLGLLAKCLTPAGRVVTLDPCFVAGQSRVTRLMAQWDRGGFVRDEDGYRCLVAKHFRGVEMSVVPNIGSLPSIELIMRLSAGGNPSQDIAIDGECRA